jgi:GNAT superfamily N-acetyltransferase/putative transposon-encoded protein
MHLLDFGVHGLYLSLNPSLCTILTPIAMDVSDLTVVRATEAQAAQAGVNCFQHWLVPRGFTSMAQLEWFGGQLHDDSYPWTAGAASWVLVPRSDPTTLDFLAACDTYGRVGVVCTPEGKREEVTSYAIASVFTPDKFRKKGYATHLLRLMHYVVADRSRLPPFPASWGAPPEEAFGDGVFSVLYSDVGDAFYANCTQGENKAGWVAPHDRAPHRVWKLELDEADRQVPEHWTWLADEDLPRLEEEVSAYMASAVKALGDGRSTKVYIPPKEYVKSGLRFKYL